MPETWEIDGVIQKFDANQCTFFGQLELVEIFIGIKRQVNIRMRRIRRFYLSIANCRVNGEEGTRTECMRRTYEVAKIESLADTFDADGKITAHIMSPTELAALQRAPQSRNCSPCRARSSPSRSISSDTRRPISLSTTNRMISVPIAHQPIVQAMPTS